MPSFSGAPSHGAIVQLYRYDLTQGMAAQMSPVLLGTYVEAVWHTGIVVFDREFYFDGGVGVVSGDPGATRFGRPHRRDTLGTTHVTESAFRAWVASMRSSGYGPNDYNLLQRNCNHFTQDASMFLLGIGIGEDIRNMIERLLSTPLGGMVRPMLESMTHSGGGGGVPAARLQPTVQAPPAAAPAVERRRLLSSKASLTADELESVQLAMALVESSLEEGDRVAVDAFVVAMQTIDGVLQQVLQHPEATKYRRVKVLSPTFQDRILAKRPEVYEEAVATILAAAGFTTTTDADGAQYYQLDDGNGSAAVLQAVSAELRGAVMRYTAAQPATTATTTTAEALRATWHTVRPGPSENAKDWVPIGREGGTTLYAVRVNRSFMGKAKALWATPEATKTQQLTGMDGHYLGSPAAVALHTPAGRVKEVACNAVAATMEVLSVPVAAQGRMIWVPLWLLRRTASLSAQEPTTAAAAQRALLPGAIFTADEGALVARAHHGGGTHPAVVFPRRGDGRGAWGEEVVVPYGGSGVDVTATAEILCDAEALPEDVRVQLNTIQRNGQRIALKRKRVCAPLSSIDELLAWQAPNDEALEEETVAPQWLKQWTPRPDESMGSQQHMDGGGKDGPTSPVRPQPRLLVCHDFKGGYRRDDASIFTAASHQQQQRQQQQLVDDVYTVHYWHHVDLFVYFSHARISIPPQDWIVCAHRHGVPVLGTFITEWEEGRAEWAAVLTDPQRMGNVINQLVAVAEWYGFEGYMLNVENTIATHHIQRLAGFVKFLRQKLRDRLGVHRARVVWYDAVTTEGKLSFQNALTERNRTFFDASDAIFTNYFWQPSSLRQTELHVGSRRRDVFVGIDCFGRSTYGGGGFRCDVAVQAVDAENQCVALFAPAWTLENASGGSRQGFHVADARLWSSLEPRFFGRLPLVWYDHPTATPPPQGVTFHPLLTGVFSRGAGDAFYWCGERLEGSGAWVQRAGCAPASLPSGHRVVCGDEERWRLATFDPQGNAANESANASAVWRDAQLLSASSDRAPYFGDGYLALLPEFGVADTDGGSGPLRAAGRRWVQLYATRLPLPEPSAATTADGGDRWFVEARIVWRRPLSEQHDGDATTEPLSSTPHIRLVSRGPQRSLEAPLLEVALPPSDAAPPPFEAGAASEGRGYVVSSSTSESTVPPASRWTSSMVCWELDRVDNASSSGDDAAAAAASSAIVSLQLRCASSIDVGLVCVSAVRRQDAASTAMQRRPAACAKVDVLVGACRSQGSLRLLWTVPDQHATPAMVVPTFLIATLSLPGKPKVFLGQHDVPTSAEAVNEGDAKVVGAKVARYRCFVDVDVDWTAAAVTTASSSGTTAYADVVAVVEAVDPHNAQDSTVIWRKDESEQ